jgi:PPK2 family polyphosphate:nucleotide phosphotransferase
MSADTGGAMMLSPTVSKRYCIRKGQTFRLSEFDPADTGGLDIRKDEAKTMMAAGAERLKAMQERLYADQKWSVLIIVQGMDAAGKDGLIKHVMSGVNPLGCTAHSFKAPTEPEFDHDYLWRCHLVLPRRGQIGIFNRSYYEEVLVVRVRPELLAKERLPAKMVNEGIWNQRFDDMVGYERYLARNGIVPIKIFLHLSRDEQRRRLLQRIENPAKRWKLLMSDVTDRRLWDRYMDAYEDMIRHTANRIAPWHVVPADNKWFARLVVTSCIVEVLEKLDPQLPRLDDQARVNLEKVRQALLAEA